VRPKIEVAELVTEHSGERWMLKLAEHVSLRAVALHLCSISLPARQHHALIDRAQAPRDAARGIHEFLDEDVAFPF
jgi:hypothetical protein